jgi:hypothetical protein
MQLQRWGMFSSKLQIGAALSMKSPLRSAHCYSIHEQHLTCILTVSFVIKYLTNFISGRTRPWGLLSHKQN